MIFTSYKIHVYSLIQRIYIKHVLGARPYSRQYGHSNEDKKQWPLVVDKGRKIIKQKSKIHSVLEKR